MNAIVGHHPGAVWIKLDFQCHTPRDRGWMGSDHLPGGTAARKTERVAWAERFLTEAAGRGLGALAVTDHHDIAFLPYVIDAFARGGIDAAPVVFPGVEITCSDDVQCLAIFEPGTDALHWRRLLSKLDAVVETHATEARTAQIRQCGLPVARLFEVVAADETLATRVMLIPHFGNPAAHKSLNAEGFASRFAQLPCDGVYIECPHADLTAPTLDKIQGRIEEWGKRRRAILATGDNRNATWERLGSHECWLRLGETTLEAVRQAFLADEARVSYVQPQAPTNRVVRIEIQSSITGSTPLSLTFNDGFTALIGGRGSGKSALLEFLRYGLGKSDADIGVEEPTGRRPRTRERTLIEETLRGGWVAIELDRGGLRERWMRTGDDPTTVVVSGTGEDESITVADAQRRFPARAFHQKELSTTMVDPETAAEHITGIAAAEVIEERRRIDGEIGIAKRQVTIALQDVAAFWQAELELERARGRVADVRRRLDIVRERMAQGGVQTSDLAVMKEAPRYGRARNYLDDVRRRIVEDREAIGACLTMLLAFDRPRYGNALDLPTVAELDGHVVAARTAISASLNAIHQDLGRLATLRDGAAIDFGIVTEAFDAQYAQARERQAAHGALIKEGEMLAQNLEEAEAQESRALERFNAAKTAPAGLRNARDLLTALTTERFGLLTRAAEEVAGKSAGTLLARVARDRKPAECVQSLCAWMEGSMIRNPDRSCSDWVAVTCRDGGDGWEAFCDAVLGIYRAKILAGSPGEPSAEAVAELKGWVFGGDDPITNNQAARLYARLSDQTVEVMLSAVPRDSIVLTYVSEGQRIAFGRASPGQQASALLELLLRQEAGTLIVDQPEDDLDNRVIMRIVERLRSSKSARQIIFSTHNANLVVNGDADKVVTMVATVAEDRLPAGTTHVRVEVDGAIETPAIRQAVTRIMEGGLEAFDLRARKYGVEGTQRA